MLFVALAGERFDGNAFVAAAAARGAAGAVVSEPSEGGLPQVVVGDTQAALTALAATWRQARQAQGNQITSAELSAARAARRR